MYRLTGRLEAGDLAELYRAERLGDSSGGAQPVVIKLLHPNTSDAQYATAAGEVARRLKSVTTPGVTRILEVGSVRGRLAIVREDYGRYTLGQVLRRLYTREVFLPSALAIAFLIELLDLLQAAHAQGLVHGALTPGNVLVSEDGRPGLADFGALECLQASTALLKTFGARGRNSYRAPELKGAERATVASDVYAAGAIAYELLTLHEASTGAASVSTRNEKLPPPSRLVRKLNSRIDPLIMRTLESAPARRQKSCGELATTLREFVAVSGGLPARGDLQKFVSELFPKDVVIDGLGPVPFDEAFGLGDLAGVRVLSQELEVAEVSVRAPFSGGGVNERTPTSDGLPAIEVTEPGGPPPKTEPEVPTVQAGGEGPAPVAGAAPGPVSWDAPSAPVPEGVPIDKPPTDVYRRLRPVPNFEAPARGAPPEPAASGPRPSAPAPKPPPTVVNYVTSFQRSDVPVWVDMEPLRERARQKARVAAAGSTFVLMSFVIVVSGYWYMTSTDMVGDLVRYLPGPVQEAVNDRRHVDHGPVIPVGRPLPLPDFDKTHPTRLKGKRRPPATPSPQSPAPERPQAPGPPAPPPPARVDPSCYAAPASGSLGSLAIAAPRGMRVEIDGKRVCGGTERVPATAGLHRIRISAPALGAEFVATQRVQAGRTTKVVPTFKNR